MAVLTIDCTKFVSGGGQILRSAISLSAITQRRVNVINIRKKRQKPGLGAQHVACVQAAVELTDGNARGLEIGSQEVEFTPNGIVGGEYRFDVGTAGAVTLVAQCIIPLLSFAEKESWVRITGGTHVRWSPPFEYVRDVLLPALRKFGQDIDVDILRYGFFPNGGGEIELNGKPKNHFVSSDFITRGRFLGVEGVSYSSNLPGGVSSRQAGAVMAVFPKARLTVGPVDSSCPASVVVLRGVYENICVGSSALGERGVPAEDVGLGAAEGLKRELNVGRGVDVFLGDQILLHSSLAVGKTKILTREITPHMRSNMALIEMFCGCIFKMGESKEVTVGGIGLKRVVH
ncbi:MAG: RNA 3'-terminal phosphate cyclase [Candidatus Micrarchaeota archaeon]